MIYRISFIEDDEAAKAEVRVHLEKEFEFVDIPLYKGKEPIYKELKYLVEDIFNSKLDAIVIDFSFFDKAGDIKFDGAELTDAIQEKMLGFPVFVLSARPEAESSVSDVNLVYNKGEYYKNSKILNNRIKLQIGHYREKISDAEKRLKELLKKQEGKEELTLNEEEELIKLDDFLESTQLSSIKVPLTLKETSNIKKLNELIIDTQKLIKEIEEKGKDA